MSPGPDVTFDVNPPDFDLDDFCVAVFGILGLDAGEVHVVFTGTAFGLILGVFQR